MLPQLWKRVHPLSAAQWYYVLAGGLVGALIAEERATQTSLTPTWRPPADKLGVFRGRLLSNAG